MTIKRWSLASILGFIVAFIASITLIGIASTYLITSDAHGKENEDCVVTIVPKGIIDGYKVYVVEESDDDPEYALTLSPIGESCCSIVWILATPDAASWSFFGMYGCKEGMLSVKKSFPSALKAIKVYYRPGFQA